MWSIMCIAMNTSPRTPQFQLHPIPPKTHWKPNAKLQSKQDGALLSVTHWGYCISGDMEKNDRHWLLPFVCLCLHMKLLY
jgi:hypothetical protein